MGQHKCGYCLAELLLTLLSYSTAAFCGSYWMAHRLLQLKLTDGKTTCKALEHAACPFLDIKELAPGTKLRVTGTVPVKLGLLLLEAKLVQVLPHHTPALYSRSTSA